MRVRAKKIEEHLLLELWLEKGQKKRKHPFGRALFGISAKQEKNTLLWQNFGQNKGANKEKSLWHSFG